MYVIKSERLKNFLYCLGFNFKEQEDKTGRTDYVYLFSNTKELKEAITFYTEFRKKIR